MYNDEQIRQIILDIKSESETVSDKALKELHSTTDPRFVTIALAMLDEDDYEPVRAAMVSLRNLLKFNPFQFLPRICQFLEVPSHCATAIWFIWSVGDASYIPRLIRFLFDPDAGIRSVSLGAMARYGHPNLLEIALTMINDENSRVRSKACGIISHYPSDNRMFDVLISRLHDDGEATLETVGSRIAIRLGEIGDERAIEPLMDAVRHGHERLAFRALFALRDMQANSLENLCLEQVRNKHEKMRKEIMYILSKNPKVEFTDMLISVAQTDPSESVKIYAGIALRSIGTPQALAIAEELKMNRRQNNDT